MTFSDFRILIVCCVFGHWPLIPVNSADVARDGGAKPNIILCMTDDQGWGDVSYNGLTKIRTPNLDAMADAGLRFNRFYGQQSCSPCRAGVMTGRHPNRMGVFWPGMPLRKQETTIAQLAKNSGYITGHFGKWHLNGVSGPGKVIPDSDPLSPRNCGFDESFSVSNYFETDWTFGRDGVPEKTVGDGADVIVAEALKFIRKRVDHKQRFLAVIWYGSPHAPHKPLPADLQSAGGSAYFGEIVGVDRSIGTLRAGLRELGIAENTLVWFNSDNGGWQDPDHPEANGMTGGLRGRKGDVWEGGIRVPCVVEWPVRIKHASISEVPAGVVDIYPTLADILQVKAPAPVCPIDGISLLPLLEGRMSNRPKPLGFWQVAAGDNPGTESGSAAWIDNRFKLIKSGGQAVQLFDLTADPGETSDVAASNPGVMAKMKNELEDWQQSVLQSFHGADYVTGEKSVAKVLPLPGEVLEVAGCTAFVILPTRENLRANSPTPWVWYAPTLPGLPEARENWMFERFLAAGIAVAGVDVGESYGSPQGRSSFSALYDELVKRRGFSRKPCLLARSRGGLMLYNWAAEHPGAVGGIAGIYPVCNIRSWPGLEHACAAYGLTAAQLDEQLPQHNPIERLAPLAAAGVPLFHIHGDADTMVPLAENSGTVAQRYRELGGSMDLLVPPGQGHNVWDGFFQCQELVDFVIAHCRPRVDSRP